MKIKQISTIAIAICLLTVCCGGGVSAAPVETNAGVQEAVVFSLEAEKSEAEGEIIIHLFAQHAADVYAYEVVLQYEPGKLKLLDSRSGLQGISVNPLLGNRQLRFAHTQIGKVPGASGDLKLASFVFKQLHKGDSAIRLHQINLVSSDLNTIAYQPGYMLHIEDTSDNIQLTDISGHWAEQALEQAVKLGFVDGYMDGTFQPQRQATRAEFVAMLARALRLEMPIGANLLYADDERLPLWAKPYIYAAADKGLIFAYEDYTFRSDLPITRIEMTAIAARVMGGNTLTAELDYIDADQIPAWGYEDVATATAAGLVQGKPGHLFAPNESATRAEAVVLLLNVLKAIDDKHISSAI